MAQGLFDPVARQLRSESAEAGGHMHADTSDTSEQRAGRVRRSRSVCAQRCLIEPRGLIQSGGLLACLWLLWISMPQAFGQLTTVKEIARMKGDSEFVLQGLGLVTGLGGTGDQGKELAVAQPLAAMLAKMGNELPNLEDLAKTKSVALVSVTCRIPRGGAVTNDTLDVTITTLGSASSIDGGYLQICILRGPFPGDPVFATAYGEVIAQNKNRLTVGTSREAAKIITDIRLDTTSEGYFDLVVEPWYRGYPAVSQIAASVNGQFAALVDMSRPVSANGMDQISGQRAEAAWSDRYARALDDRTVRVFIPQADRSEPAAFIAEVMGAPIDPAQLDVPARVIVNSATGAIAVAGEVRISPVVISVAGLTISTTIPEPVPTEFDPLVQTTRWAPLSTDADERDMARLEDLQNSFRQLNVPIAQQIEVLQMLKKMGKLHAELIID